MRELTSRETLIPALSSGIAVGFLFSISLTTVPTAVFFVALPMLLAGLALGARPMALACLTGALTATLMTGPAGGVFFAIFIAIPCFCFVQRSLLWRDPDGRREWFPMLRVLCEFSSTVACLFVLLAMATQAHGGLPAVAGKIGISVVEPVLRSMAESKDADPDTLAAMHQLGGELSFTLLAGLAWTAILMLYGLAVLANAALKSRSLALRPSLAIEMRGIPLPSLMLLVLSALLAMLGDPLDRYTARTLFLILLLPYFLSGMATIHTFSLRRGIPLRKIWLACVYIVLIYTKWPILAVIAIGLCLQLSEILDRQRKMR